MNSFSYTRASDVRSAVQAVSADPNAVFIAGGTNLIDLMKENVSRPRHLVDITRVPLNQIENLADGGLRLGALVTNADTAYNNEVERRYPMLSRAILAGASAQLRNMATNGGNLLQRTRCYYFYDTTTPCNKRDPGAGCSAIDGFNRIHAILGTSDQCIAVHPSDMCVALVALEAVVRVTGKDGDRTIPFADFHRLPGDTPQVDTNLRRGEIITSIDLPRKGFADHYAYLKVRDRTSYAFALVSVAAALEMDGDTITETRLALGGVAHKPWRDVDAEAMLTGIKATKDHFEAVGEAIVRGAKGFGRNTFKIDLARRAVVRALQHAATVTRTGRSA
jgi:xanthine dehydrogenase YagS FAD-binding subunit